MIEVLYDLVEKMCAGDDREFGRQRVGWGTNKGLGTREIVFLFSVWNSFEFISRFRHIKSESHDVIKICCNYIF